MSRLTMRQLRIVLAIADHGSLVTAAKHLNITQPAISKALQETEALLGMEIFSRTNRGVVPTPCGMALAAHGRLITTQLRHAMDEISDLRDGVGGRIAIGTLLAASADLLPRAVARFRQDRPKVAISIVDGTHDRLLPDLHLGKLDLVVGRLPEAHECDGLKLERLITDTACIVVRAGHPLLESASLSLADLLDQDWVLPRPETGLRGRIDQAFREASLGIPPGAIDSVSYLTNRRLVIDHDYIAVWPWLLAHRDVMNGKVAILPVPLKATNGPVGITLRAEGQASAASLSFIEALREIAATIESCPFVDRS